MWSFITAVTCVVVTTHVLWREKKKIGDAAQVKLALGFKGEKEQNLTVAGSGPFRRADALGPEESVRIWSMIPNTRYQIPSELGTKSSDQKEETPTEPPKKVHV